MSVPKPCSNVIVIMKSFYNKSCGFFFYLFYGFSLFSQMPPFSSVQRRRKWMSKCEYLIKSLKQNTVHVKTKTLNQKPFDRGS